MKITIRKYLLFFGVLLLAICSLLPLLGQSITKTEVKLLHSESNTQAERFRVKCASGYTEVPVELNDVYLQQSKNSKNVDFSFKLSASLKNEIEFYGFTYFIFNADKTDGLETSCLEESKKPENIRFVGEDINNVVRMFISALIFNEKEVAKAQLITKGDGSDNSKINELNLCVDIQCGLNDSTEKPKLFNYTDFSGIKFSRIYSDSKMFDQTRDNLRNITDKSDDSLKLTDSEIVQILTKARIIAYTKAQDVK